MPATNGVLEASPMPNGDAQQTNGHARPHTPTANMALTEYSAAPSPPPPSDERLAYIKSIVPEEYLLPSGYPDVCYLFISLHGSFLGFGSRGSFSCAVLVDLTSGYSTFA